MNNKSLCCRRITIERVKETPRSRNSYKDREVTDMEVAEAVMAVEEEATVVNTAAALITGSGPNTVRLQGSSTG